MIADTCFIIEDGSIYGEKRKQGSTINPQDAMIAGIARSAGEKNTNPKHQTLPGIENVSIDSY